MSISLARMDMLKRVNTVLESLRKAADRSTDQNGWCDVYLDNALATSKLTDKEFRGCLASLSKRGLYQVIDGYAWGKVKMS